MATPEPPDAAGIVTRDAVYAAILREAAPIADLSLALDAELSASALLGGVYTTADIDRDGAVRQFATDFADYLTREGGPRADAVRATLASLLPAEIPARSIDQPAWASSLGRVVCTGTWRVHDTYGDQSTYVVTFQYADPATGGPDHAVSYLIDHNLRQLKSIWISAPAQHVLDSWRSEADADPRVVMEDAAPARVRGVIMECLRRTDALVEPPSEEYPEQRAFGIARLGLLPEPSEPVFPGLSNAARDTIVADFLESPESAAIGDPNTRPTTDVIAWGARAAVDYAVDDNSGDPLRWSPTAVKLMLLDWAPRQLSRTHRAAPWLPEVLDAFVAYAGRRKRLPGEAVAATQDAITAVAAEYTDLMTGEVLEEPVLDILARLVADGVDPMDEDAVLRWVIADRKRRGLS